MDLKKEKNEVIGTIEDITIELENMNKQFNGIIDLIFEGKEYKISNSISYISEQEQNDSYQYVMIFQ